MYSKQYLYDHLMERISEAVWNRLNEMEAHHGSAANFNNFDDSYMGTGEGAQVYGWGTYVTDSVDLAEWYIRDALSQGSKRDVSQSVKNIFRKLFRKPVIDTHPEKYSKDAYGLLHGYLYELQIPDDDGTCYIDWNLTDKTRIAIILELLKHELSEKQYAFMLNELADKELSGKSIRLFRWAYRKWNSYFNTINRFDRFYSDLAHILGSEKEASQALYRIGYTGIKVAMGNSNLKDGDEVIGYNYVIFNSDDIRIIRKQKIDYTDCSLDRTTVQDNRYIQSISDID